MSRIDESKTFLPVNIAVLTVSDTRTAENDTSGDTLAARITASGHHVAARAIERDDTHLVEQRLQMATHLPAALLHPLVPKAAVDGAVRVEDCMNALREIECRGALADLIASLLLSDGGARQTILQSLDIEERLRHLNRFLTAEIVRAQKDPIE